MSGTVVSIQDGGFAINGRPTYAGRSWKGHRIEGLLFNSRMVQATFDDLNPDTRSRWAYPDGPWDAERNVREFLAAMPSWRKAGLLAFTINLQGGSPMGYSKDQPWHNSAFDESGGLRPEYLSRLERVLGRADQLGMVVIVGYFYFGQDERLRDEAAVVRGAEGATDWLLEKGYANVLVEIANEVDVPRYEHARLQPPRCPELIRLVQERSRGRVRSPAGRLLVSTSMSGAAIPTEAITEASDFLLLHGNGVKEPDGIRRQIAAARAVRTFRGQPVLYNEDDHFDFDRPDNNFLAAVREYVSWGYFDYRFDGEGFDEGYQSVPANWGISSERKRGFFRLLAEMTGSSAEGE